MDPFVVSSLVCVFGCFFNPLFILTTEATGTYEPVQYDRKLKLALAAVAFCYTLSCVLVNRLYYAMKASWGRVALNLQIVVTFCFDIFIAKIKFSRTELIGCSLLLLANVYLVCT